MAEATTTRPSYTRPTYTAPGAYTGAGAYTKAGAYARAKNPYDEEYAKILKEQIYGNLTSDLTSPEAQEDARQRRSKLAGSGVSSGSAFDVAQGNRVNEAMRTADTRAQQAYLEAILKGRDFEGQQNIGEADWTNKDTLGQQDWTNKDSLGLQDWTNKATLGKSDFENTSNIGEADWTNKLNVSDYERSLPENQLASAKTYIDLISKGQLSSEDISSMETAGSITPYMAAILKKVKASPTAMEEGKEAETATKLGYDSDYEMSLAPPEQVSERIKASKTPVGGVINGDRVGAGGTSYDTPFVFNGMTFKWLPDSNSMRRIS